MSSSRSTDAAAGEVSGCPVDPDAAVRTRRSETAVEARRLFAVYARTRNVEIRNRLVTLHEPVVRYVAARFGPVAGATSEDLVQVGFLGLIAAVERFEPDRKGSFSTFAVPTIVGVIKHYLRDHTWAIKAPRRLRELGLSLRRIRSRLEGQLNRAPTVAEMAEAAGVSEERLLEAMDLDRVYHPASLDASSQDGESNAPPLAEVVGVADPELSAVEVRESLRYALGRLDERQRLILYHRFFKEATQAEVAQQLGMSQMHVSRLERQALRLLREALD